MIAEEEILAAAASDADILTALQDLAQWHVGLMACLIAVVLILGIFLIVRD